MPELRKEIRLGVDKRLMYIDHPQANCLEVDIEQLNRKSEWITRTSFSLKYDDLQKLVEETGKYYLITRREELRKTKTKPAPI